WTVPVAARAPPSESSQSMPESGTPNPLGLVTSSCIWPETPPKPAAEIETSRTLALGFSIERMKMEQPERAAHAAMATAQVRGQVRGQVRVEIRDEVMLRASARRVPGANSAEPPEDPGEAP